MLDKGRYIFTFFWKKEVRRGGLKQGNLGDDEVAATYVDDVFGHSGVESGGDCAGNGVADAEVELWAGGTDLSVKLIHGKGAGAFRSAKVVVSFGWKQRDDGARRI